MIATTQSKSWYILGAGALGCLWAHHASEAGHAVTLILRNAERLELFKQNKGVTLVAGNVNYHQACEAVLADSLAEPIENLLICCKAQQTGAAFASIADALSADATVVLLQNGMGVAEQLLAARPQLQLFAAVSTDGVHQMAPFSIQRAGHGVTRIGRYPRELDSSSGISVCQGLQLPQLAVEHSTDIYTAQWEKLAINAVINPLTALYDIRNGELPSHPQASPLIAPLCLEISTTAALVGISMPPDTLQASVLDVCDSTADNISSMAQDIRQHRATEIRFINGYIQDCARQSSSPCPINDDLISRVESLTTGTP